MKQEGLRGFWCMFPLTRGPFWCRFFEPQPIVNMEARPNLETTVLVVSTLSTSDRHIPDQGCSYKLIDVCGFKRSLRF